VLLDFSAIWCPPCNLLSAEVLHADPMPAELEGWHVAVLDVDHASSWTLKDRYGVGGYPTVIAVDAEGTELSRVSGYPGRQAFLDWLATATTSPDAADLAKDPSEVGVARAAELAWKLVSAYEHDAAKPWVERAGEEEDSVVLRMARLGLEPTVEDAEWLLDHGVDRISEWGGLTLDLAEDHPEVVRRVLDASLPVSEGPDVADIFWAYAQLEDDEAAQQRWYASAAAALRAALSGDPEHDRAYYSWLARLMEMAGDRDGALAFLADQSARFEGDPTFDMAAASMLVRAERHEEALPLTEAALANAWGDNRLRAATTRVQALVALDRTGEAEALVEETLAQVPAPEGELDIRTPRYRELLEKALEPEDDED
jgi:thioredoxin-like negative regulator of GroEL